MPRRSNWSASFPQVRKSVFDKQLALKGFYRENDPHLIQIKWSDIILTKGSPSRSDYTSRSSFQPLPQCLQQLKANQ